MRNASGMVISREVLWLHVLSFVLLQVAIYSLLALEFYWRVPDLLGFYFWEAMIAMLSPFILFGLVDIFVMEQYRETGHMIRNGYIMQILLDGERIEEIRRDHRFHPLLFWLLPARSPMARRSLFRTALWFRAHTLPQGSGLLASSRDPLMLGLGGLLLMGCLPLLGLPFLMDGTLPERWLVLTGLGVLGLGSLLCGLALLRCVAVKLALADFLDGETWDSVS